jgi:hypothetical protein
MKMTVNIAQVWHGEAEVEIDVPDDATDQQIRKAASLASCDVPQEKWEIYDSDTIHVVKPDGNYIY